MYIKKNEVIVHPKYLLQDVYFIDVVRGEIGRRLLRVQGKDITRLYEKTPHATGEPTRYALVYDELWFFPKPDKRYRLQVAATKLIHF